jgi:hypothetical protein
MENLEQLEQKTVQYYTDSGWHAGTLIRVGRKWAYILRVPAYGKTERRKLRISKSDVRRVA